MIIGMPEAGLIPIPRKLAQRGIKDMLRISDGRMSGTAGGSIILHVSPESVVADSVFGVVEDGDMICCNVEQRSLTLQVSDEAIKARISKKMDSRKQSPPQRGYRGLYERCVGQAETGADFDFLTANGPRT